MSATCEAFRDWSDPHEFCGEPAIGTVFAACEHEHVNEAPVCAACAVELQQYDDGDGWQCARCDHDCLFHYEIRFNSGKVLVLSKAHIASR